MWNKCTSSSPMINSTFLSFLILIEHVINIVMNVPTHRDKNNKKEYYK